VFGLLHVVALYYDVGPEVPARFDLDDGRHGGHDDRHGYPEPFAVVAQRLRVVAQRRGDHAVPFVIVRQHHQRVARAAFFETERRTKTKEIRQTYTTLFTLPRTNCTIGAKPLLAGPRSPPAVNEFRFGPALRAVGPFSGQLRTFENIPN